MKWVSNFDLSILVGFATIVYVGNRLFLIGMILLMFLIRINRIFGNVQKINPFIIWSVAPDCNRSYCEDSFSGYIGQ